MREGYFCHWARRARTMKKGQGISLGVVGVMEEVVVGVTGLVLALGCLVLFFGGWNGLLETACGGLGCCHDACLVLLFDYSAFSDVFVCVCWGYSIAFGCLQ